MEQLPKTKKVMKRKASDNKYLHKDFHLSMNILMNYINDNFGKEKLIEYLEQFAEAYHKPINQALKAGDIDALFKYFTDIYNKEEWPVKISRGQDYIEIKQDACPGITHIKAKGGIPCPYYIETYQTVYSTVCKDTSFEYVLKDFDYETGACEQLFINNKNI
jgi:hypothetical protein